MRTEAALKAREIKKRRNREFYEAIKDIIKHPVVQEMKKYPHHANTSCFQHCVNVAYFNYQICRLLHLDAVSAARAGMLHDLFLYNWHYHRVKTGDHFHAMTHPRKALENAQKYFILNDLEKEIILKHMWPLTVVPPKHWESFIIGLTDKFCGSCEMTDFYSEKLLPKRFKIPVVSKLLQEEETFGSYCKEIWNSIEHRKQQS